MRISDQPVKP
jgi:hypothetical protein